jgi:uncharacterized RDD family membrane protein YckC
VTDPGPGDPEGIEIFGAPPAAAAEAPAVVADPTPAPVVLRAFAFLLDGIATFALVALGVSASLGVSVSHALWAVWVVPLLVAIADTALTAWRGVTPGKAVLGLRVVDIGSGAPVGAARAALRGLVIAAPAALGAGVTVLVARATSDDLAAFGAMVAVAVGVPLLGWIALLVAMAVRPRHRGVQDLAGRSVVLRVR